MERKASLSTVLVGFLAAMGWWRGAPPSQVPAGASTAQSWSSAQGRSAAQDRRAARSSAGGPSAQGHASPPGRGSSAGRSPGSSAAGRGAPAGRGPARGGAPDPAAAGGPGGPCKTAVPEGWCEPLRLYGEFFGLERTPKRDEEDLDQAAGELAKIRDGYTLDFLVALVPDPIDSQMPAAFDQALDGIQKGLANLHADAVDAPANALYADPASRADARLARLPWLLDRSWLPWTEPTAALRDEPLYRSAPGLLLFRKLDTGGASPQRRLMGVFLVGETPKRGIHHEAFRQALRLIQALRALEPNGQDRPLAIVGPSYSGSAESLRLALLHARTSLRAAMPFEVVTGSATAAGLEELFADRDLGEVGFFRTVLPDGLLQEAALRELHHKMGWNLCKLALITENDTAYGQGVERALIERRREHSQEVATAKPPPAERGRGASAAGGDNGESEQQRCSSQDRLDDALVLHFPSHVSAIRSASEAAAARRPAAAAEQVAAAPPKTDLGLDLGDEGTTADRIPELSPLTAADNEQAIANLLESISREGIGYVGILASDVKDRLFLADRIRRFAPDVTLFTLDADLLYSHRQVHASTDGMLVLSTFQLFTEGGVGLHGADLDLNHRRQFTSDFEEGIFHAVRALTDPTRLQNQRAVKRDPVLGWISVSSGGSLWPLLNVRINRKELPAAIQTSILALEDPDSPDRNRQGGAQKRQKRDQPLALRADLILLLFALVLCVLAAQLRRAALAPDIVEENDAASPQGGPTGSAGRVVLCFALTLLALAGAFVLVLEWIEYLALPWGPEDYPVAAMGSEQRGCLLGMLASYLFLVWNLANAARAPAASNGGSGDRGRMRRFARPLGWLLAAAVAVAVTWITMLFKFIPGEVEYFELRTRVFSSGLSPVVSLGWLVGALYVWALFELKRRGLIVWQQVEWPLADSWDPALRGSGELAQRMRLLIGRAFPGGRRLAIATAVLGAVALWGIGAGVQPIGETPAYARVFFSLLLLLAALAGLSFLRFWRIWRLLRTLLRRLEQTPFLPLFPALSLEIAWKPMHSFSWRMPGFNPLVLSVRRLETLARGPEVAGGPPLPERAARPLPPEVPELLSDSLVAGGSPRQQVRSRHELERLVHEAGVDLASRRGRGDAEIDTFLALRVIAYVRYVFFHLRSCLSGGLFPVLLLLFAISSYAFEPKSFFSFALLGALLLAVAVTLGVFLAMDRNPALSRIGGNEVGEITLDRTFFLNVLTYGVLPLLGLLATQVPAAGQLTHDWIKPMLRIIGIG